MTSRVPRLLPLLAVAIGGVLALKAVAGLDGAPAFLKQATAFAEDAGPKGAKKAKSKATQSAKPADAKAADAKAGPGAGEQAPAAADAATPAVGAVASAPVCAPNAAELAKEAGLSPAELRVLQSLQSRRGELDEREKTLETQLAVLGAAESKVDGKLKALTALKAEIQGMLGQADQKQDAEIVRMVTVYSAIKPEQAALIMTQLDDKVRIPVAARMKERTLAAILAKMAPLEARKLTEKLAGRFTPSPALTQKVAEADNAKVTPAAVATPARAPVRRKPRKAIAKAAVSSGDKPAEKIPAKVEAKPTAAKAPIVQPLAAKPATAKPAATPARAAGPSA